MKYLTWVEISKEALIHNIQTIKSKTFAAVMFIIKANAYGHGIFEIAKIMKDSAVEIIGVQSVYELESVRAAGFSGRLIIIGPVNFDDIPEIIKYKAEITLYTIENLTMFQNKLVENIEPLFFHLKIETGLHRQGLEIHDVSAFCKILQNSTNLVLRGISTHFANIENSDDYEFSQIQHQRLVLAQEKVNQELGIKPELHCANSGAVLMYPEFHGDMVRPGIISYGMFPSSEIRSFCIQNQIILKPVLSWKTKVMHIHIMQEGETLGYGRTFTATKSTKVALLPVGYYDGYHRNMRNGKVMINNVLCPVVGSICMNMMMCDISDINDISLGDEVLLCGNAPGITPDELAKNSGTINYEITTQINERIPRIIV